MIHRPGQNATANRFDTAVGVHISAAEWQDKAPTTTGVAAEVLAGVRVIDGDRPGAVAVAVAVAVAAIGVS